MQRTRTPNQSALWSERAAIASETSYALNVAVVCQDGWTAKWAADICRGATAVADLEGVCAGSWRMEELREPEAFSCAVQAAARADVIMVSVYDTDQLAPELRAWINAWLRRRGESPGALLALVGAPDPASVPTGNLHDYLQAAARKGHLDFLPHVRRSPAAAGSAGFPSAAMADGAGTPAEVMREVIESAAEDCRSWRVEWRCDSPTSAPVRQRAPVRRANFLGDGRI